ncbi:MAG: adenylate/guanylate cyclase domain-containing protein, partial [Mycobacteriales bacterium]
MPTSDDALAPYLPRLVVDWLAELPQQRHCRVDGTLAFVDISGFTRLTERLAGRGKQGAEEMGDVLNSTFEELLTAAYDYGAGLVKWGGDAALLLFDGSAHAARACRAAIAMQRTMRRIGGLRTSSGPVRLQMSIGVHSGRIDFYLVGSAHRELVVAGESATLTAVMEQVAGPAQTVLSAATVAALGPSGTGLVEEIGPETGYYLLRRAPAVAPRPNRATKRVRGLDLGRALPTAIREHVAAGPVEGEHRHLAIAFVEFAGTDELTARFGADTVAETLDELMRVVQAETERNGVTLFTTDINRNGGKLLLVAGAPRATGDDETNLLAAVRAILAVDSPLRLRAGANSGRAYVGDFGPSYRRTYSI